MELLFINAHLMDPAAGLDQMGSLLCRDGRIAALCREADQTASEKAERIDCKGLILSPGLVDMHVHLRDPGFMEKEDILSGCCAAAAGGVTSLLCMPNTNPALDSPETIEYVLKKAEKADAHVYPAGAISKGLKGEIPTDLAALKKAGAIAFSDDGRPVLHTSMMASAMQEAKKLRAPILAHCEDLDVTKNGKINEGIVSRELGIPGIPRAAEDCGTARELALAAAYEVGVHICHVSTKESVSLIRDYQKRGVPVTCETAPHYFALTEEELLKRDADARMSPPLRTEKDRLAIIKGLQDGTIAVIATDHAPHTPQEKTDFLKAPNGAVGMETSLAAGITYLVRPGFLSMMQLLEKMSTIPAKILHLPAGTLAVGAPADLILFDPDFCWRVDPNSLHGKSRNAVFKGKTLFGKVERTFLNGKCVFIDS
ncbi:dihydroorotase [Caproicibacterium sp. NSD3]